MQQAGRRAELVNAAKRRHGRSTPTEKGNVTHRVPDLVAQEQADDLDRLLTAVDIIAEEQVVRLRRVAAELEQAQQVRVLPASRSGRAAVSSAAADAGAMGNVSIPALPF